MNNPYKPVTIVTGADATNYVHCPICACPVGRLRRALPLPLFACKSCGTPLMSRLPFWMQVGWSAAMVLGIFLGYLWLSSKPQQMNDYIWYFVLLPPAVIFSTMLTLCFFFGYPVPANSRRPLTTKEVDVLRAQFDKHQ